MPQFLLGVVVGFFEPILHAWSNVMDNYMSNRLFPKLPTMIFFGTLLNVLFLPLVLFTGLPSMLPYGLFVWVFVIALIDILYLFPYMWSLRHVDTSIVTALFSLGKVFVPIFAFFVVGEELTQIQYLGFALTVIGATALTFDIRKLRFNIAFFFMLFVSIVMAAQAVMFKYVFDQGATWPTVVTWLTAIEVLIAGAIMLVHQSFASIKEDFGIIRANIKIFALQQLFEWGGNVASSYALFALPATVARAIASTQSFLVLGYAALFGKRFPALFTEDTAHKEVLRKALCFLIILVGVILIVLYGTNYDV